MHIYIFSNSAAGLCKIGISKDVKKRKRLLENSSGCSLVTEFSKQLPNARQIERIVHENTPRRCQGEWFQITPFMAKSIVQEIIEMFEERV